MTTRYRLDPGHSRFTVQAFAAGMLSFLGHSPTFAVRDFGGEADFEGDAITGMRLEVVVKSGSLGLVDQVRPGDRQEIEGRMRGEVLDANAFPEVVFQATAAAADRLAPGRHRVRLQGTLALRGVTRPYPMDAELVVFNDGIRLRGETLLRMSDFGIRPVTALGGMIKLKDEVKLAFDLAALPDAPQ